MKYALIGAVALSALLPAAALAETAGSATTELNLRQGPGSNYPVIATIPAGGDVSIIGCVENSAWCQVEADGAQGYAYGRYLTADAGGTTVTITERPGLVGIVTAPVGIATGALGTIAGTLTGGGIIEGENRAGDTVSSYQSPPEVIDYVRNNPSGNTIYLDGEAVPGAVVPSSVSLTRVPDTQYEYANINGDQVVVDRGSRTVVFVVR